MKIDDDEGRLRFELTVGGEEYAKELDLYESHDKFVECDQKRDDPAAHHAALAEYLQACGFPPVTYRTAVLVRDAVYRRVAELKKAAAGSETPGSAGSTGSGSAE